MRISNKSLKSVKAMLDVAMLGRFRPVPLAEISRRRGFSMSHLEVMFRQLRRNGLVRSIRGAGGGYRLNRHPSAITIADIFSAVEGDRPTFASSLPYGPGAGSASSATQQLWQGLDDYLIKYLHSITLTALVKTTRDNELAHLMPKMSGTPLVHNTQPVNQVRWRTDAEPFGM